MKNLVLLTAFACLVACNSTQTTEEVTTTDSTEVTATVTDSTVSVDSTLVSDTTTTK